MKKSYITFRILAITITLLAFAPLSGESPSSRTHIRIFAHTNHIVDINADNYSSKSTIDMTTGEINFVVPMAKFEFTNTLMEKHYNGKEFMDTEQFPTASLTGKIKNIDKINFYGDSIYKTTVIGELNIKGVTTAINEKGIITVKSDIIIVESVFIISLLDYNIIFTNSKLAADIRKTVKVSIYAEYPIE